MAGEIRMKRVRFLILLFYVACFALFLFSYTQVDLNLTLSRAGIFQSIQKSFQYVGYYQRPIAAGIYVSIVSLLFVLYGYLSWLAYKNQLSIPALRRIIIGTVLLLVFSYPAAFSYDFFNYLFTAKTVLVYHQNPYTVTPLQFAGVDPWTNFMRWTHLSSAYTPLWIAISIVPYIAGLGYFILVLFATKLFIAACYLASCYALTRIASVINPAKKSFILAVFALNPLLIVESLVSGHNDIVLVMFALFSISLYLQKRYDFAWLLLGLSVAAKLMTIFLVPVYLLKKNRWHMFLAMVAGLVLVLSQREFLPWYWVWILPFVALNYERITIIRFSFVVSAALLLSYVPYLYFGEYSSLSQAWKMGIIWGGVGLGAVTAIMPYRKKATNG
jgi:hypothetical protein